eukprot:SAG31_NODE_24591_length_478_cov_0.905013_2_plen_69_part_01
MTFSRLGAASAAVYDKTLQHRTGIVCATLRSCGGGVPVASVDDGFTKSPVGRTTLLISHRSLSSLEPYP